MMADIWFQMQTQTPAFWLKSYECDLPVNFGVLPSWHFCSLQFMSSHNICSIRLKLTHLLRLDESARARWWAWHENRLTPRLHLDILSDIMEFSLMHICYCFMITWKYFLPYWLIYFKVIVCIAYAYLNNSSNQECIRFSAFSEM